MDEGSIAAAKEYAARRGTSVSALLRGACGLWEREIREGPSPPALGAVIQTLRAHRRDLEARGVRHVAVFGSVARGDANFGSDVDVAVALEPGRTLLDLAVIAGALNDLLGARVDVASLGSVSRSAAAGDLVHAF